MLVTMVFSAKVTGNIPNVVCISVTTLRNMFGNIPVRSDRSVSIIIGNIMKNPTSFFSKSLVKVCPRKTALSGLNTYMKDPIEPKNAAVATNSKPLSANPWKISHFDTKPPIGGIPAMEIIAMRYTTYVTGILCIIPPISLILVVPVLYETAAIERNAAADATAWLTICIKPPAKPTWSSIRRPINIYPPLATDE